MTTLNSPLYEPLTTPAVKKVSLHGYDNRKQFFDEPGRMEQDRQQLRCLLRKVADSTLATPADGPYFDSLRTRVKIHPAK